MADDTSEGHVSPVERTVEVPQLPHATQGEVLEIRDSLREIRETMSLEQFNQWAATELQMDEATAQDFLAFAATTRLTPGMWEYFERVARGVTLAPSLIKPLGPS